MLIICIYMHLTCNQTQCWENNIVMSLCSKTCRSVTTKTNRAKLTKYLQTKTLTNTARITLPTSRKSLKESSSSVSELLSWAAFSLANWPFSFMASSKRDRYFWMPLWGEPREWSSVANSPRGLCLTTPPRSSSRNPPLLKSSLMSGKGEPLRSGVSLGSERNGESLLVATRGVDQEDSFLSKSRWNRGSTTRLGDSVNWKRKEKRWDLTLTVNSQHSGSVAT